MVNSQKLAFIALTFIFTTNAASATLPVIADFGGEPVPLILAEIMPKEDLPQQSAVDAEVELKKLYTYPFSPSVAKPGKHKSKDFEVQQQIAMPIALVGTDNISAKWFRAYKKKLFEIGATVLIVEAKTEEKLRSLMMAYKGQISPLQKSDLIFSTYNIKHYPVLITADGVYQ